MALQAGRLFACGAGGRRRVNLIGDLLDGDQLVEKQAGTAGLVLARAGVEAVGVVVLPFGRHVSDAAPGAVVIGHHQPVRRDERGRAAAAVAQRGEPHVLEPLGRGAEVVALAQVVERRVIERPHLAQPGRFDGLHAAEQGRRLGFRRSRGGRFGFRRGRGRHLGGPGRGAGPQRQEGQGVHRHVPASR